MKVLVTGSTNADLGIQSARSLSYLTAITLLVDALRWSGHDVERRAVLPGESLKEYDAVFVGLYAPIAFAASEFHAAMWVFAQRPDAIGVLNDWQVGYTYNSFEFLLRRPKYLLDTKLKRTNREEWRKYESQLLTALENLSRSDKYRVLVPTFPWGNRELFPFPDKVRLTARYFDPSPMVVYKVKEMVWAERERQWIFAALANHDKWLDSLDLQWPVVKLGHVKSGFARIDEMSVISLVAAARGTISFPYDHAGSGWWRIRVVYAALTHTPLLCSMDEAAAMGKPYKWLAENFWNFERSPDDVQRSVALDQARWFLRETWNREQLKDALEEVMKEDGRRSGGGKGSGRGINVARNSRNTKQASKRAR